MPDSAHALAVHVDLCRFAHRAIKPCLEVGVFLRRQGRSLAEVQLRPDRLFRKPAGASNFFWYVARPEKYCMPSTSVQERSVSMEISFPVPSKVTCHPRLISTGSGRPASIGAGAFGASRSLKTTSREP